MRGNCLHNTVLGMVGPDWYQELSPKQLETVDHLERCILQDYVSKGYINTKENMAALGLVLRPNQQKLERALQICCGDPVEFLLTLYQLSNPKRKQYSVNDRLILSAVVHLTMTFTLRELHVRIPSPPRKPKVVQEEPQEVKKAKYKSPYLVPYTFKPEPPAHTGEYINSQIQHPESPYFSYLEDLAGEMAQMREDPNLGIMSRGLDGTEIVYEIQAAQDYYNEIHGTNKNCILPPTILVPLEKDQRNAIGDTKALLDDLKEMTVNAPFVKVQGIVFVNAGVVITNLGRVFFVQGSYQPCDLEHPVYQYEEKEQSLSALNTNIEDDCCNVGEQDVKCIPGAQQLNEFEESEREKSPAPACNEVHPTFEDSSNGDGCICTSKRIIGKPFNGEALFVNGGIAISRIGPAYLVSYSVVRVDEAQPLRRPRICCMKGAEDSGYWAAKGGACTCVAQRKAVLRRYQHCYPVTYVIGGIVMTEVGPAYMVSSVCKKKEIKKPEVETADPDACKCKQEVDRFLKHRCECETCRAQERQDNATFIIAGMKGQEIDPPIPIISACVSQKNCNCLERYMEKLKTMHEYRQRLETRWRMMSIQNKYAIGGVVQTARGPMYMLTGIRPPIQCACAEMLRKQDEEKEARKRMPEPPPAGRIKYHIQGVRQMKCGQSVYILSQALPVEPCPCEELFNRFQGAHSRCMDRYKSFMSKIQEAHKDWGLGERWYESDQPIEEERKPKTLRKKKKKKDFHATFMSDYDYDAQYSVTTPVQDRSSNMSFLTWDNVDDKSIDMRYDDRFDVIDDPCVKTTSKNYTAKSGTRLSRSKEKVSKKAVIIPEEKESEIKTFFPTIGDLDCSPTDLVQEEKKKKLVVLQ
ncbi:unnamed protein product [Acanthoscelides obtectus]|uniref:DUF4770 domain-containing protein n=1 Tax=Acanthoscelides obtectus TaxID=200917 RepID=A0A9P0M4V4_ACAOB|nr:unnamed protein product [Acanthoscelides obtectus]CAK1622329.1 hypothetical protein AOBTE_LOCUS1429 [Acanthoscelides obtectus]